nr:MAG TPA: hypothetical protein [Caudoviricetes sp.]
MPRLFLYLHGIKKERPFHNARPFRTKNIIMNKSK